jgi:hypothetical protein
LVVAFNDKGERVGGVKRVTHAEYVFMSIPVLSPVAQAANFAKVAKFAADAVLERYVFKLSVMMNSRILISKRCLYLCS